MAGKKPAPLTPGGGKKSTPTTPGTTSAAATSTGASTSSATPVAATTTTSTLSQEMQHVLETVFALQPGSSMHKAFQYSAYAIPEDFILEPDDVLDDLAYIDDNGDLVTIPRGNAGLLKTFKKFVTHAFPGVTTIDWTNITRSDFNAFRVLNATSPTPTLTSSAAAPLVKQAPPIDLVREFKRGIKHDISQFPTLKDDSQWDNWNRGLTAQARAQGIADVLDPSYLPTTQETIELFQEQLKFMYAVFEKTLLTDKGKALVRYYQQTFDAQSIYRDLSAYAMQSTKAAMSASNLLSYITTTKLGDGTWKGTTHAFILHWQDQVRKYHDLSSQHQLSPDLQRTLLQNAVHPIMELRQVKLQADQLKTHMSKDLTYDEYCSLLLSAAQQYDTQHNSSVNKLAKRRIYEHDFLDSHDTSYCGTEYDGTYDIDIPIADLEIHSTKFQAGPRLSYEQWKALPDDAKKIWDMLSQEAKAIILRPFSKAKPLNQRYFDQRKPTPKQKLFQPPRHAVNNHEIDYLTACLHELHGGDSPPSDNTYDTFEPQLDGDTSVHEDIVEPDQPLLAHVTKKKPLPPGNVKRLLSPAANSKPKQDSSDQPQEVNLNGIVYRQVNTASVVYKVSASQTSHSKGALIDRGANGGIAGDDVRVIAKTGRCVDIQGIDNHRINEIPIVTAGGVITTQKGPAIAIMHQYAYTGKGKSIHSCAQLEAHKQTVHDKSIKVGGKQRIETLDGYIIPLNIRSGLPYMSIRPYTDSEWENLPHVILTADTDWDPTVIDWELEDGEEWLNAMQDLPEIDPDPLFDDVGDYKLVHHVTEAVLESHVLEHHDLLQLHNQDVTPSKVDYSQYQSKLAWLPVNIVEQTFAKTTQFYRMPMGTYLKKRYKSPFPACNVHRQNEPVATDTVYSDTPAIDSGVTAAQFFVGTESLVCDIYPIKTDKQFVNVLQDNIRRRGAMSKLISDRAQVEISNKVQDILRNYIIKDWQSEPHCQHQNAAERRYQDAKRLANTLLDRTGAPPSLWFLALTHVCMILNHTVNASIRHAIPMQVLTGVTPDISSLLQFDWYEPVYYRTEESHFPSMSNEKPGRFVGISEHVGHALTFMILTDDTQKIIHRSVVRSANNPDARNLRADTPPDKEPQEHIQSFIDNDIHGGEAQQANMPIVNPEELVGRILSITQDNGESTKIKIVEAIHDQEISHNGNPSVIKFKCSINNDAYEEIMSYNQILEYLSKDDNDIVWKFQDIIDHQGPLTKTHKDYKGSLYNLTILWENGETSIEPLSLIAADDPVSCAIYARKHNLINLPGWKRLRGLAKRQGQLFRHINQVKIQSFGSKPKFKYGFEIPRNYKHAVDIDKRNGNTKWQDATALELESMAAYDVFKDYGHQSVSPQGYKKIRVHLIYDVKHDGRHKARLVADGHLTDIPNESVYSSVVSLRGLRMMLFLGELNEIEVWGTDIGNAYLEACTSERVCITAGPEFGPLEGHLLLIHKALYGLRSSGARWHDRLSDVLRKEGFIPCKAEPDIWMRQNGEQYEYVAVYVDDLAFAVKNPASFVHTLKEKYQFKIKDAGPLEFHLGADFYRDDEGILCMAPQKYIDRLSASYEKMFGEKPSARMYSPLDRGDHPELDDSELLDAEGIQQYQSLIGSLQWAISLGRFDIATSVMSMSSFRVLPRRGHLQRLKRICGYLVKMKHATLRFRVHEPDYSDLPSKEYDWASTYGEVQELLPDDAPPPLGRQVTLTHYVDANLFHDALTGRSVTGILHMMNATPIDWYSKKQATVETATYGSEFVAARICVEQIVDLRNTLRYLGVPIQEKSYMFGDNESVVNSSSIPHAKLHKRHTALSFHRVREAVASKYIGFYFLPGADNPADILSKHWSYSSNWSNLQCLLFWKGDTENIEKG